MQVSVKGKQIDVGEALRGHVATSLDAVVGKYFGNAIEASAVFSREAHLIRCDVSVHIGRDILVQGEAESADAYAAFDGAADRIGKRLRRHKRRLRPHHSRPVEAQEALPARSYVIAPEREPSDHPGPDSVDDAPVVIAEMATEIPMLTVSEAVMRMDLANVAALLFLNRAHGRLNVVYRRADGNVGWVDPELSEPAANSGR
jgi:ribosomal subunit interface protein